MKIYQIVLNTLKVSKTDEMETKDDLVDKRISKKRKSSLDCFWRIMTL